MTVRRIEQIPVIAVGQTDQFQKEVDIKPGRPWPPDVLNIYQCSTKRMK
jgi:hypothetical protein